MYVEKSVTVEISTTGSVFACRTQEYIVRLICRLYERCRAYLSDWWDENGEIQFEGRVNLGVVTLNLPMILMKSKVEKTDFYKELDYYLNMIRGMQKRRFEYVGKARADSNPLMFMHGGALGGNLKAHEKIEPLLKSATISFGITALNEMQTLFNGKSLNDDNRFAVEVMEYINNYINKIKIEDNVLYAIYGNPAESLCGTQVVQFRKEYGIIEGVSDKDYFSNSFHLHVSEEITPFEKQDKELELFRLFSGGKIQYGRVGNPNNKKAIKQFINRGLKLGFYQGVNFNDCTCEDCGHHFFHNEEIAICPECESTNITEVIRLNGYMGWKQKCGYTTVNSAKLAEVKDRKSM